MEPLPRVQWIVDGVHGSAATEFGSSLASNRYRVLSPYRVLRSQGCPIELLSASRWDARGQTVGQADVVAIGKLAPGGDRSERERLCEHVLGQIEEVRHQGVPVVADFNDDHFDKPGIGEYWRRVAALADLRVAGSEEMRTRLKLYSDRPVQVIGDPVLAVHAGPRSWRRPSSLLSRFSEPPRLRLLWFGNLNNWPSLVNWIRDLESLAQTQPWLLRVVTTPHPQVEAFATSINARHQGRALVEVVEWSEEVQQALLAESHVVLIPSDPNDPAKRIKTANRLIDAVQAGNVVVASPLPAYEPYAGVVSLTDRPAEAIRGFLADPAVAHTRVAEGQAMVARLAGEDVIAASWLGAFRAAAATRPTAATVAGGGPLASSEDEERVRLNLGCGDKILPGYVNVDVVAARSGKQPDVQCDLRRLTPFADASVDEVMAIHVVEHFWRWEIEAVLKEWIRVLKPGGRMVLECPNLLSACQALLDDPEGASHEGQAGQRSMWVFYGDPRWRDPLMVHRWGYTPGSLIRLLKSVGLVEVAQQPAEYKLREPRDMRVVGIKPGDWYR